MPYLSTYLLWTITVTPPGRSFFSNVFGIIFGVAIGSQRVVTISVNKDSTGRSVELEIVPLGPSHMHVCFAEVWYRFMFLRIVLQQFPNSMYIAGQVCCTDEARIYVRSMLRFPYSRVVIIFSLSMKSSLPSNLDRRVLQHKP